MVQEFKTNNLKAVDIGLLAYFKNQMHRLFTVTVFRIMKGLRVQIEKLI